MAARVAINGLGRIGRATLKIVHDTADLQLVAVNDVGSPENLAYLLRYDSFYGRFPEEISNGTDDLVIGNQRYKVLNEPDPSKLPWRDMEIDLVFDCTGVFTQKEDLEKHLQAGARKVILSAPAKGDGVPFVVEGVNEPSGDSIVSCASCTTNCCAPVIEIVGRRIGMKKAIMTTVHAYTVSQPVVDAPAKKWRRGRAAAINLVPTTTGAAQATIKALPQHAGRFDGIAIRAPVPVGSIVDLTLLTERPTSVEEVNGIFEEEALSARYEGVMGVVHDPIVSSDIIQDARGSVVDLTQTRVVDGDLVKIMSWYDNEWGYAAQMVRTAARMTGA